MKKCVFWLAVSFFCIENVWLLVNFAFARLRIYHHGKHLSQGNIFFCRARPTSRYCFISILQCFLFAVQWLFLNSCCCIFFTDFTNFGVFLCVLFYYAVNCHHIPSSIACTTHFAWHTCTLARLHTCTIWPYIPPHRDWVW